MSRTELIHHDKKNEKLFDYYCKDGTPPIYVLKVDGKTIYEEEEALTDIELQNFIKYYAQL